MEGNPAGTKHAALIDAMATYNGNDMRRIDHALKVYGYAMAIAARETRPGGVFAVDSGSTGARDYDPVEALAIAAILHDIGIHEAERKHHSSAGNWQELEGPPVAREVLAPFNAPAPLLDRVLFLIGHHHSYGKVDGPDFRILVEADFIVNAREDGMKPEAIAALRKNVFRTAGGTALLDALFSPDQEG